ncbi:Protein kinase-like (PK-like) [Daldinia childiae]|uniref:Protein kinase-like (PK-like) n=1 Tax=Daldinia childiae TaxID=326645 RepID=UPI0014488FD1|nr:Protein kinase-like (PK-like) [Daldinia childiae]KAF3065165.1 Protein kinase-like (PK-like) [Daldinia childiae]
MPTLSESVLYNYTAQILGITIDDATGPEKNSQKSSLESQVLEARLLRTFITLVLIGKVETIPSFIVCGFTDSLLPIGHAHFQNQKAPLYYPPSLVLLVTRCFNNWTLSSIDAFIETQWVVLSPFLSASTTDVSLYDFSAQTILPILDDDATVTSSIKTGGYSTVRKVKIHHRHHDFGNNQDNLYFALKELRSRQIEDFQREVAALRPFVVSPHQHVVKLLAAFRHESSFYLLFPWAEGGSLHSFWKDNPKPVLDTSLSRWVSEQCLGIANALYQIHHGHSAPEAGSSHYGRHGDIKPSNILLFKKNIGSNDFVWMLSDFGLGTLHRQIERSRGDHPIGFSPTYRAPELDIKGIIDSAYDIWSLGCVFLELLTWMLCGWEGVKSFALSRVDVDQRTDKAGDRDDGFFRIVARQGGPPDAQLKSSVVLWVNNITTAKATSPYITDLVNLTRNDLLDTNRETRASISRVVEKLQCLRQRCLEDPTYTVAIPRPRKPPEHIYRNHCSSRRRCDRCFDEFENMYDLQQHRRSETPCLIRDSHNCIDTIDETQKGEIRKKQRGISEEEKWKKIYRIIFKLDPTSEVPSPYCDAIEKESGVGDNQDGTDTLAKFETFLHRLADDDHQNASEINSCLNLVKRFRREHAQDQPVETVLSEMPSLTCDYSDSTAWTSESQGFPSSTLTTIDDDTRSTDFSTAGTDQLPAPPFWDDSFAAHFNKVFSSNKPYSFPDTLDLRDDGGTLS